MSIIISLGSIFKNRSLWCSLILSCLGLSSGLAQTFGSGFGSNYTAVGLSQLAFYNNLAVIGLTFAPGNPNQLIFDTDNGNQAFFYSVAVTRGTGNHITGFATTPHEFASFASGDLAGGLIYAPNGTLLFTYSNSAKIIGEIAAGSSSLTKNATVANIGFNRITGLQLTPNGFTGAGQLLFSSFDSHSFYSGTLSPDGQGTYNVLNAIQLTTDSAHSPFGGLAYVPSASPDFSSPSLISADGSGLYAYSVNASGYPIASSVQKFFTDNGDFRGAVIDPMTGGVGKLIVAGDGTLALSGTNTYTGGIMINGGTLEAAHATAGSIDALGSGFVMLNGGTLRSTVTGTLSNSITFGAGFTSTLSAATGQTLTLNTFVTIVEANARFGSTTDNGTIVFAPIGTSQNSGSTIEVAGGTTISAGMLQLGNGGASGSILGNVSTTACSPSTGPTFSLLPALSRERVHSSSSGPERQLSVLRTVMAAARRFRPAYSM